MSTLTTIWCGIGICLSFGILTFILGMFVAMVVDDGNMFNNTILLAWVFSIALAGIYISNDLMNLGWF